MPRRLAGIGKACQYNLAKGMLAVEKSVGACEQQGETPM